MERIYEYENGTIYVSSPDVSDRRELQKATEEFLKKVIKERLKNGNSYTSGDIRKK